MVTKHLPTKHLSDWSSYRALLLGKRVHQVGQVNRPCIQANGPWDHPAYVGTSRRWWRHAYHSHTPNTDTYHLDKPPPPPFGYLSKRNKCHQTRFPTTIWLLLRTKTTKYCHTTCQVKNYVKFNKQLFMCTLCLMLFVFLELLSKCI